MRTALCLLTVSLLSASETAVNGPISGFVADATAIRPMLGIPGAAVMGDPIITGATSIAIANSAGFALACIEGQLKRIDLSSREQSPVGFTGCPGAVSISPSGSAAVAVAAGSATVLKGASLEATGTFSAGITACSVSDDAALLLCSTDRGMVSIDEHGTQSRFLPDVTGSSAFLKSSRDAVVAAGSQIFVLRDGSELQSLGEFNNPSAVAVVGDNEFAAAASKADRKIAVVSLAGGPVQVIDCPVDPDALAGWGNRVQVTSSETGPAWLLMRDGDNTRLVFVPKLETANE